MVGVGQWATQECFFFFYPKESNLKTSGGLMGKRWTDLSKGQSESEACKEMVKIK